MKPLAVLAVALGALVAPALAHAGAPPIARPDPVTFPVELDYTQPLPTLQPLEEMSIQASVADLASLEYEKTDDLGGFAPAPIGRTALSSGGRDVRSTGNGRPQIPLFSQMAGGAISSFTYVEPPRRPAPQPDNGNGSGNGVQPPVPPTPENVVPPANQGFGGSGGGGGKGGGGTTTTRGHGGGGGTTTTTTTAPTTTTTVVTTTTTTAGGAGGGGGGSGGGGGAACSGGSCSPGACGVPGISITSSVPTCTIAIANAVPGDSVQETMTVQNTSGSPYTLSLKAVGPNNDHLRQDLEMAVYDASGPAPPLPWPLLTSWLGPFNALTTLNPGQTVQYVVVLYLPTTAGNADQGETQTIDFIWHAS